MSEKLSILIAQANPIVGDIDYNKNIVLETINKYPGVNAPYADIINKFFE